ncbi:MAG TPA: glycyl-radical enzyme activating protein [Chloroflexota bacterium]|nr:glycyl-radical enzyme activating protein [Chloroflexota bacterium]
MLPTGPSTSRGGWGLVFDVDRFAIHDGPGIRTTVFLKGCPLRCWWCHSPESQSNRIQLLYLRGRCSGCGDCVEVCPAGALRRGTTPVGEAALLRARRRADAAVDDGLPSSVEVDWTLCTQCGACAEACSPGALVMCGTWRAVDHVFAEIERDRAFFERSGGGVTLTGGEVTQQGGFARALLDRCRAAKIHTAVETCGLTPWRVLERLAEVTDLFLYDVKHMDDALHRRYTGASNAGILSNLRQLASGRAKGGHEVIVRVPCIPGVNDDEANIAATAAFTREVGLDTIHLLPYNASAAAKYAWIGQDYALEGAETQSREQMERLAAACEREGLQVQIGG